MRLSVSDSGVDPAAAGLRVTSDGKQKVIDVIDWWGLRIWSLLLFPVGMLLKNTTNFCLFTGNDCLTCSTGSGDVDTSTVVKADEDGCIVGASGTFVEFSNNSAIWFCLLKI